MVTDLRKEPRRGSLLGGGWPHSQVVVVESCLRKEKKNKIEWLVLYKKVSGGFSRKRRKHREKREERAQSVEREKSSWNEGSGKK